MVWSRGHMVATGICYTDAIVRDGLSSTSLRAVLGHKSSGVVEAVGASVTSVVPGDHAILAAAYCGHCSRCRRGETAYCENVMPADLAGRRLDGSTARPEPLRAAADVIAVRGPVALVRATRPGTEVTFDVGADSAAHTTIKPVIIFRPTHLHRRGHGGRLDSLGFYTRTRATSTLP